MTTKIEWCSHSTNAVTGCLGPGGVACSYCYAIPFRKRLGGMEATIQAALRRAGISIHAPAVSRFKLFELGEQLRRARKPRRIFVGSMGDLGYRGSYFCVEPVIRSSIRPNRLAVQGQATSAEVREMVRNLIAGHPDHVFLFLSKQPAPLSEINWPLNAHVGVSISSTADAERDRLHSLGSVECGCRWASVEPLLDTEFDPEVLAGLDWVVVGADTSLHADDPRHWISAAKRIVAWCADHWIPCFVKDNMIAADPAYPWPRDLP